MDNQNWYKFYKLTPVKTASSEFDTWVNDFTLTMLRSDHYDGVKPGKVQERAKRLWTIRSSFSIDELLGNKPND